MFNKKLLSSIDLGKYKKKNPYKKDIILDPMGQWKHPGKNTRIPSSSITMKGVNYPVLGVSNTGQKQMMQPGKEYNFPGADYVDEYPQMKKGGLTKAQKGIATYQDSLDVYINALQQQAYYDKLKPYYNKVTTEKNYLDFAQAKKAEKELLASGVQPYWTPQDKANFQKTKNIIKANKDKNIAYLTDIITGALDPNAPGLRYDARIKPQGIKNYDPYTPKYTSKEQEIIDKIRKKYGDNLEIYDGKSTSTWLTKKDVLAKGKKLGYTEKEITGILYKAKKDAESRENLKGFYTTIPYYDPIAVKPGRLLTDAEVKKRVEKYGTDGIPKDKLEKLGLKDSKPPKTNTSTVVKSPCSNPITTVVNNVPEKAPFGKKLVGTNSETLPVTGKKCEYVQTINPIYEDIKIEPIELGRFPVRVDNGALPSLQVHDYSLPNSIEAPQYTLDPYTADRLSLDVQLPQNKIAALFDKGVIDSKGHIALGKRNKTRLIPRMVQKLTGYDPAYFEGYENEEGNFVPGELDYGNETGSEMEFRGAASLRDFMNQQKYKKEYEEYDKKLDTWLEQYEQSKKKQEQGQAFKKGGAKKKYTSDIINSTNYLFAEHPLFKKKKQSKKRIYDPKAKYYQDGGELPEAKYGHSIGNLIRKQNGGQLPRAQFGFTGTGEDRSLSFTPFDFRSSYGQSSDYNRNPNYSLTYTTPKLFKKADLAGNPLSITLGRPYNTDAQSLTNRTLNFIPQEGLFSSYYDPATQGGSNPQYQQYLQDVSDTTGTPVSELNQTIINQYNAAKNLAGAKPLYKKGIPLTANVGYDIIGNAFGDSSSGPFTGALSLNAGYAPEPGLYGTADASIMGVFGRRKNNASIKPQRYFDKGLTRQGDMAFIPKLNILNFALRQRPEYNESQTQQILDAYAKDIEQGTTTAKDFITNKTDEKRFDMSFLSPEATFQIKPFKNFPGVASITGGLRLDYGGKETSGDNIPITPKPYGNVRYTVPIEGAIDKLKDLNLPAVKRKKTYNDYANDQEYDEEYTGDTPQEDTPTENNIEVNPPELQVNPNGTVIGRGDCPEGYERPCPKCRCQKIKMPQMYTDKRGAHLFGNEPFQFEDGGVIELELTDDQIEEYRKGGYVVEDISVPSLTRMQPGGLIETAAQLLKQATPGNKVRNLIYSGINPAGYGLKTKLLNFPKELSLTKAANETRPFRVGMSLQNPESLSKFLLRNNMANSDWDALSDLEKMQMMSKPKVDRIVDTGKRRLDAFAVGLKQPQEYGTLEQVGDNTFRMKDISYDPEYFSELYTDILAKNMLDKSGVYLGEDPLVTIAKQHYDRSMHPHLRGLLGIADQTQLGKDAIAKMSKMTRSQIDKLLRYPNRDFAPWKQSRIVELSKINQDPNFKYSIYDNDEFGVMGGFRWDLADTPEGMLWQGNDTWDLNPWQNRGETRVDTDPFVKKLLAQHYRKPLQHLEALSLVGGKPFDIQNNFLIDPGTFKTIKQYQNGGEYGLGDEVDEATMKQLKELGYTFEKI